MTDEIFDAMNSIDAAIEAFLDAHPQYAMGEISFLDAEGKEILSASISSSRHRHKRFIASPYDQEFLDRVRSAFKISEIVGRKFKLRKHGAELVAIEDPSISVNDRKGIYHDFETGHGGDVFEFMQRYEGYSFTEAVEELARRAGLKPSDGIPF